MTSQPTKTAKPVAVVRASTLRMAKSWQTLGQVNQAIDAYCRLLTQYADSLEAQEAAERLLALAQAFEAQGRYHLALGLYSKLERLS